MVPVAGSITLVLNSPFLLIAVVHRGPAPCSVAHVDCPGEVAETQVSNTLPKPRSLAAMSILDWAR